MLKCYVRCTCIGLFKDRNEQINFFHPYLADNSNDQGEIIYSLPVCLLFANFLVKVTFLVNDTDVVLVHVFPGKSK